MKTDLSDIHASLAGLLMRHSPLLVKRVESDKNTEFAGTKEVMQGKQKVQGHYFASLMPKPKDVRFYFFPIYTHRDEFEALSPELQKALKGKSCFHIKKLSADMEEEISGMIQKGVELYQRDSLI